jgi:uncharacterized lipoprotein YddW (UPF0748 family)
MTQRARRFAPCFARRSQAVLALLLVATASVAAAQDPAAPPVSPSPAPAQRVPRFALWVPCEGSVRVLDDASRVPALVADARALGATDLFVQVYRGGRAWFSSSVADASPHRAARERHGADPLARLLVEAHAAGLRVHAWINALSLATQRDAKILKRLGPEAVMIDRRGRSVLDYPELDFPEPDRSFYRMGTPQVWIDPAVPSVGETLAALVGEMLARYPQLDGVHLDYIRHPDVLPFSPGSRFGVGVDFGYGPSSRARFERETGLVAPFGDSLANADRWDDWRRERVSEIVLRVASAARAARPHIEVSAAVWAYADRAYLALFQDWRGWLEDGLLDFAVPMAYTRDDRLLRYLARGALGGVGGDRVWIGLGPWLFAGEPDRARAQLDAVLALSPPGVSLFSYDALADAPALRARLLPEPPAPAVSAPPTLPTPDAEPPSLSP